MDNYVIWESGNITYFDISHSKFDDMYINMKYYHSGTLPVIASDDVGKDTKLIIIISSTKYEGEIITQISALRWSSLTEIYSVQQLKEHIIELELEKWSRTE